MSSKWGQSQESVDISLQLGNATALMLLCPKYRMYPLACLAMWTQPPILLKQIHYMFSPTGTPVGFLTWAYLATDVEERWINDPKVLLHFSEWNEGESLWIMDYVAPVGHARGLLAEARELLFLKDKVAKSLRRNLDGTVQKITTWTRN